MRTPEEIAREAAERLVGVGAHEDFMPYEAHRARYGVEVCGKMLPPDRLSREPAEVHADELRGLLYAAVLAAVEEALRDCPVPSPVSEARLKEMQGVVAEIKKFKKARPAEAADPSGGIRLVEDLLADNAHLRAVVRDCWQDGSAAVWAAGYEAGVAAQE